MMRRRVWFLNALLSTVTSPVAQLPTHFSLAISRPFLAVARSLGGTITLVETRRGGLTSAHAYANRHHRRRPRRALPLAFPPSPRHRIRGPRKSQPRGYRADDPRRRARAMARR